MMNNMSRIGKDFGMQNKTKVMRTGKQEFNIKNEVDEKALEPETKSFRYIGSLRNESGDFFRRVNRLLIVRNIPIRIRFDKSFIWSVVMYAP